MSAQAQMSPDLMLSIGRQIFLDPEFADFFKAEGGNEVEETLAARNAGILSTVFDERIQEFKVEVSARTLKNIANELVFSGALKPFPGSQTAEDQASNARFQAERNYEKVKKAAFGPYGPGLDVDEIENMKTSDLKKKYDSDSFFRAAYDHLMNDHTHAEREAIRTEQRAAKAKASTLGANWTVTVDDVQVLSTSTRRHVGDYFLQVSNRFVKNASFDRKTVTLTAYPMNSAQPYSLSDARLVIDRLKNEAKIAATLYHRTAGPR